MIMPENIKRVLTEIAQAFDSTPHAWLLGGSCALWLQGVELINAPKDIDLFVDEPNAAVFHQLLAKWAVDEPRLDEDQSYSSLRSHYLRHEIEIELVGGFHIYPDQSSYQVEIEMLNKHRCDVWLNGVQIPVMPLSHELLFNVMRQRSDRYEAIAAVMSRDWQAHLPLLENMIAQNQLNTVQMSTLQRLISRQ